ncbi:MAG: DUF4118 domain-containing protein [Alicyclobacillus macrosporangiidus]|uniref:DUF4118 domain-containing protein n=1 Tax=Alicyclobacillus macrosporangiidus TaxID=392015 RepID=UPI0026E9FB91|nr:DUF4118 domain-containing protein [Alicyclobacillus macrosporangiidus]MCL6598315.1 DUF4118 domain-containing protein [Alicyclobacillus macrosporangiidus]
MLNINKVRTKNDENFFHLKHQNEQNKEKSFFKKLIILIFIMSLCTAISLLFRHLKIYESNIVMMYLLGILLFSYVAGGYLYSFTASICGVLLYNFFFTEPYYTLQVYRPDYPITFLVMFTVGFITSMLTIKVKLETQLVEEREERIKSLYYIGKKLLQVQSGEYLAKVSAEEISRLFNANVLVQFFESSGNFCYRNVEGEDVFTEHKELIAALETYQTGSPCGCGTLLFSLAKAYYTPVLSQNGVLGVIGISLPESLTLSNTQRTLIDAIVPQIAVIFERERLYEKQQEIQLEIQGERLRTDMLRSISHDLRTPLTGIMGLASTMMDNFDKVSDEVKKNFLKDIYDDAEWLNELVENILQTTRFEEGNVKLNIEEEVAEEIVTEAVAHVKKHELGHKIKVNIPDEIIFLRVDGVLIRQVLVNLLSNALKYSPQKSDIIVSIYRNDNCVIFEVIDNGPGISQVDFQHIFERFYHRNNKEIANRQGIGLGLSLCKSIVEAHGGKISIRNNEPHGTIASFSILSEKESM